MNQPRPLKEQLKTLENLQELDLKIDALKKKKAELPVAQRALEAQLNKSRQAVEAKKNAIAEIEKVQRQTVAAVDLNKDRMTRANAKLESVQNSQEFQAANKEMDQLRKLNQSLDEQLKKTAGDIESENKALATLIGEFEKTGSEQAAQLGVMAGQSADLDGGIAKLMEERKNFTVGVEPRILSLYDRVRAARGGIGIVPSVGGRCSGCNMMVPPQVYNEIQCGTVVHNCPSCHRLLFIPEIVGQ